MSYGVATVAVRIKGSWLSPRCVDVSHSWAVMGGCGEASFTIVGDQFRRDLDNGCPARISSRLTAEGLWSGQVLSVEETAVGPVPSLKVTCEGSASLMSDRQWQLPYLVTRLDAWDMASLWPSIIGATVEAGAIPWSVAGPQALVETIPAGVNVQTWDNVRARFTAYEGLPAGEGFTLGGFYCQNVSAIDSTNYASRVYVGDPGWANIPYQRFYDDHSWPCAFACTGGEAPAGETLLTLENYLDNGGVLVPPYQRWTAWYDMRVYGQMYTRTGSLVTVNTAYGIDPATVVEDMVYRCLGDVITKDESRTPRYVQYGSVARYWPDTLDYSDPTTPAEVLNDLCDLNPDFFWMVGPADATDGLHGLMWTNWDTTPRYVIPEEDVQWSTTGDDALYNRVTVTWKDFLEREHSLVKTGTYENYPDLEALRLPNGNFRVRELPPFEVPGATRGRTSQAIADRLATVVLDAYARRPLGGTVTITEPVLDVMTGRMMRPERIRPGVLASVAGTGQRLRVTEVKVDDDAGTATLTLSNPRLTVEKMVARAMRRHRR